MRAATVSATMPTIEESNATVLGFVGPGAIGNCLQDPSLSEFMVYSQMAFDPAIYDLASGLESYRHTDMTYLIDGVLISRPKMLRNLNVFYKVTGDPQDAMLLFAATMWDSAKTESEIGAVFDNLMNLAQAHGNGTGVTFSDEEEGFKL